MASGDTYKLIKLVGVSSKSFEDAIQTALNRSAESIQGHAWAQVVDFRVGLSDKAKVTEWQVTLEAGFKVGTR